MSPYLKGALGFIGCAGICAAAYSIGKAIGREETLKEVEMEEKYIASRKAVAEAEAISEREEPKEIVPLNEAAEAALSPQAPQQTPSERVRFKKMHGLKNTIFGGASVIKEVLSNPDGKQLTMTVEDGDVVMRISPKGE